MLGRLVEHEDGKLCQQGTCDRHPLALATRQPGAVTADLGGETLGRQFVEPTCQSDPGRARLRGRRRWQLRRPMRRFSAREVSKMMRILADESDDGADGITCQPVLIRFVDSDRSLPRSQGNGATPPQESTCRLHSAPTTATRRPLRELQVDSAAATGAGRAGYRAQTPWAPQAHKADGGSGTGASGSVDRYRRIDHVEHPSRRAPGPLQRLCGHREAQPPARRRPWAPGAMTARQDARRADRRGPPGRPPRRAPQVARPANKRRESQPDPARPWQTRRLSAVSSASAMPRIDLRLGAVRTVDDELAGHLRSRSITDAASSPRRPRLDLDSLRRASMPVRPRARAMAGCQQRHQEDRAPPPGRIHHTRPTVAAPTVAGDAEGRHHAQHQVLQRVDVADDPWRAGPRCGTPAVPTGASRSRPLIHPHTQTRRSAPKRGVVADQPLPVTEEPPGQPEELHADDGHARCTDSEGC